MRLVDGGGNIVDVGQEGEIELKPYTVFKEYRKNPEKTQALLTPDGFVKTGYGDMPRTCLCKYSHNISVLQDNFCHCFVLCHCSTTSWRSNP